jgi:hypothetical protein
MAVVLLCGWMIGLAYVWWGGGLLADDLERRVLDGACDAEDAVRQLCIQSATGLVVPPLLLLLFGGGDFWPLVTILANGIVFVMVTLPRITALYQSGPS